MNEQKEITIIPPSSGGGQVTAFTNMETLRVAMQMADTLSKSDIIPKDFAGKPANCLIMLEYAHRLGENPFVVMQNVSVINGKPGLSSKYLINRVNNSGLFKDDLEFEFSGPDNAPTECYAWAVKKSNGKRVRGSSVTMTMAGAEGWLGRDKSKWKTMPRKMLLYRAASFFVNEVCPQITFGMQTIEEVQDITFTEVSNVKTDNNIGALNDKITAAASADKSNKKEAGKKNSDII